MLTRGCTPCDPALSPPGSAFAVNSSTNAVSPLLASLVQNSASVGSSVKEKRVDCFLFNWWTDAVINICSKREITKRADIERQRPTRRHRRHHQGRQQRHQQHKLSRPHHYHHHRHYPWPRNHTIKLSSQRRNLLPQRCSKFHSIRDK